MKKLERTIIFFITIILFNINICSVLAQNNSIQVELGVTGCNNNGICEVGESIASCPVDCAVVIPPQPPEAPGSVAFPQDIVILNLAIQPNFNNAFITWNSSESAISTIRWGETTEVREGTLKSIVYALNHKVELINLKPGTMYYFTIESTGVNGKNSTHPPTYFFTKFPKDTTLPSNPRNVKTFADINGITLTWENPQEENFSYVRIMRHEDRFRGNPYLGKLIYEGDEEKFLDKNVIPGKKYFYTLFSRDINKNFSSGVAVSETAYLKNKLPPAKEEPIETPIKETPVIPSKEKETKQNTTPLQPNIGAPLLDKGGVKKSDIAFFVHQYNQIVEELLPNKKIIIDGNKSTIVDTNSKTLADDFLNVFDENKKLVAQYLFSFNKDSMRYQSVISPLEKEGNYFIEIFRYRENILTKIAEGTLLVEGNLITKNEKSVNNFQYIYENYFLYLLILLLTLFLIIVYLLLRRKKQEKQG